MELGKLFIGGISWDTNEDRLRDYFQNFGEVVEAVIMKDRATGRARGFGFVVFADPTVAERVVFDKHVIDGRTVEAKKAVPRDDQAVLPRFNNNSIHGSPGPAARTRKIFVGGLPSTITETDFKKYFDQFGIITDVVVMYDHNTQRPRGFGFITFDVEEAVDKVLQKTFHELNGKMVEVKRAVPKELSPGPTRSPLSGYNNAGLGRVNNLLNGYNPGYSPNSIGGFGVRMDGRFSPSTVARTGYSPFGPGYGIGPNFDPLSSPNYLGNANLGLNSNLNYGRVSPSYVGNSNRFINSIGMNNGGMNNGGSIPAISSPNRNMWSDGGLEYDPYTLKSSGFTSSGNENSRIGSLGNIGALWGSSGNSVRGDGITSQYGSNLNLGSGDFTVGSGGIGYGRNSGPTIPPASSNGSLSGGGFDGTTFGDIYDIPFYGDSAWRASSPSELEESGPGPFSFGIGIGNSDGVTRNSAGLPGYVDGYSVTNRQTVRGTMLL
ncbi:hypothetical protein ACFE04_000149 [Oxalis oulophora]